MARTRHPLALLSGVVFLAGILSAFLANDTICVVLTLLVLELTRRLRRNPLPYLLAIALAPNVGSVATITGNPQNMITGSLSRIPYGSFTLALGPVANLIVAQRAQGAGVTIGFWAYFRVVAPLTVLTILFGAIWL